MDIKEYHETPFLREKNRSPMTKLIFRHIFGHVLFILFLLTAVLVFGAWLTQSLRFIEIIIEKDVSILHYFSMIYLLLPSLTATILPICALLATVVTLNKLITDNELIIFKSCGLSNWQIAAPVLLAGFIAAIVCGFFNQYLAPITTEQFYEKRHDIAQNFSTNLIREGVFNKFNNTMIFVSEYGQNNMLKGIYIEEENKKEENSQIEKGSIPSINNTSGGYIIFAKSGYLSITENKNVLYLYDGCRQEFSSTSLPSEAGDSTEKATRGKQNIAYFDELKYDLDIRQKDKNRSKLHNKISFWDLINPKADLQNNVRTKLIIEANRRLVSSLFILVYSLIACSIMLTGQTQRQGRWVKPVIVIGLCLTMHISLLSLLNSYWKNPYSITLCYLILGFFMIGSLIVILKPAIFIRYRRSKTLNTQDTRQGVINNV